MSFDRMEALSISMRKWDVELWGVGNDTLAVLPLLFSY